LKKELEAAAEERPEVEEPTSQADRHEKVRDIRVKGAPGTKIESMKVCLSCISMLILCICSKFIS